jgi:hypothetical protein
MKNTLNNFIICLFLTLTSGLCLSEPIKSLREELLQKAVIADEVGATYPNDAIIAVISRAYEFGSGKSKFCSPDITITNLSSVGVKTLIFTAVYFQTVNGVSRHVGQSHGKYSLEPNDAVTRSFYQLETSSCDRIVAYGQVTACFMRNGVDCSGKFRASDAGKIPVFKYSSKSN